MPGARYGVEYGPPQETLPRIEKTTGLSANRGLRTVPRFYRYWECFFSPSWNLL